MTLTGTLEMAINDSVSVGHALRQLQHLGAVVLRRSLPNTLVWRLAHTAHQRYREVEAIVRREGPAAVTKRLAPHHRYVPSASSLSLGAVYKPPEQCALLSEISRRPLVELLQRALSGDVVCVLDQAWVRRQYSPRRYPPGHAPHSWHQDGALGFDFAAAAEAEPPSDALIPMVTCWLPLTPCGRDAPGLEVLLRHLDRLLPVCRLCDEHLREEFCAAPRWAPEMEPGDSLVFLGGTLHRTHVTPAMGKDRTSVELRFLASACIPDRLARISHRTPSRGVGL